MCGLSKEVGILHVAQKHHDLKIPFAPKLDVEIWQEDFLFVVGPFVGRGLICTGDKICCCCIHTQAHTFIHFPHAPCCRPVMPWYVWNCVTYCHRLFIQTWELPYFLLIIFWIRFWWFMQSNIKQTNKSKSTCRCCWSSRKNSDWPK